jgi:riboflavin biosynthesis pyrimidine reductase
MLNQSAAVAAAETPTWVVASPAAPPTIAVLEKNGVRVLRPAGLAEAGAGASRGIESVLCEGGGAGGPTRRRVVDRLYWIQAPVWLGGDGVPAFPDLPGVLVGEAARWVPVERRALGPDTLLVLDREPCSPGS